jgi:hypothetical protein
MLRGVPAGRGHKVGAPKSRSAQPPERLPHFNPVREHNRAECARTQSHHRNDGSQVGMQRKHKQRLACRRAQCGEHELGLVAGISGNQEFMGTGAHRMQPLRIVEAQETARKSAFGGKLCSNGGDVPPSSLHTASRKQLRKNSNDHQVRLKSTAGQNSRPTIGKAIFSRLPRKAEHQPEEVRFRHCLVTLTVLAGRCRVRQASDGIFLPPTHFPAGR